MAWPNPASWPPGWRAGRPPPSPRDPHVVLPGVDVVLEPQIVGCGGGVLREPGRNPPPKLERRLPGDVVAERADRVEVAAPPAAEAVDGDVREGRSVELEGGG